MINKFFQIKGMFLFYQLAVKSLKKKLTNSKH